MQPIWNVYQSFFFLTRSPSDKFSSILDSTLKFLRDPTTEPGLLLIRYNTQTYTHTHAHTHTPWRIKLPFKQTGAITFFHWDTNPVLAHVLIYSVEKTHVLVVTVKLIWCLFLNILSFNFVPLSKNLLGSQDSEEAM